MSTRIIALVFGVHALAMAQDDPPMDHSQHGGHAAMNHDMPMENTTMDHTAHQAVPAEHVTHETSSSDGLRDPHRYSDGYGFGPYGKMHMADSMNFSSVTVDHLEVATSGSDVGFGYGLKGWWGRDFNRLLVKSSGDGSDKNMDALAMELAWAHAVSAFWNSTLGVRADKESHSNRYAVAMGVYGLAPYWFEVDATLSVDVDGRIAARGGVEYEMLFTQKLVLQPAVEFTAYSRGDAERELGGGVSNVSAALRLRYAFTREFAPYIGVEWQQKYGTTAEYARQSAQPSSDVSALAGLRLMF